MPVEPILDYSRSARSGNALRSYFQDEDAFSDYYADFSYSLEVAAFEQNRPLRLDVTEFSLEEAGVVR